MAFTSTVANCYDSHCHWAATGQFQQMVKLGDFKSPDDVLNIDENNVTRRDGWIIGFGWDENDWPNKSLPDRQVLDQKFPNDLVSFSRADGHATWVNTQVLMKLGWLNDKGELADSLPEVQGGRIVVDEHGLPTGVLIEAAKSFVDHLLPKANSHQMNSFLLSGMNEFHKYGVTHIRDMTCSELQWNEMLKLEASGLLKLAVEQTFSAETPDGFDTALDLAKRALKVKTKNIRKTAMKVYYDGALGSEGAYLSEPYLTGSGRGLKLMDKETLQGFMRRSWEIGMAIAVHAIGDQAADDVVDAACGLWDKGLKGEVCIEHAQVLREDTLAKMQGRTIRCFLQPCHFLSDQAWLEKKLSESLLTGLFPWAQLEEKNIEFFFGSDTPIEPADLNLNAIAIEACHKFGIAKPKHSFEIYQSHPDKGWVPNCHSKFVEGKLVSLTFDGEAIL